MFDAEETDALAKELGVGFSDIELSQTATKTWCIGVQVKRLIAEQHLNFTVDPDVEPPRDGVLLSRVAREGDGRPG